MWAQLWKAEALNSAARSSAEKPFADAQVYWLDRLKERLLPAELAKALLSGMPATSTAMPRVVARAN